MFYSLALYLLSSNKIKTIVYFMSRFLANMWL